MTRRLPVAPLGLALAALTLVIGLGGVLLNLADHNALDVAGIAVLTFLAFPAMGLLILRYRPGHIIAYLLLGISVNIYFIFVAGPYARFALVRHPGSLPFGEAIAWMSGWIWLPFALTVVVLLPLLFPDGRLLSRRWSVVIAAGLVFAVLAFVGNAFTPGAANSSYPDVINPLGIKGYQPLFSSLQNLSLPFGLVAVVGAVGSVAVRYRRADGVQRRQLRWFFFALLLAVIPFAIQGAVPNAVAQAAVAVTIPLLPISIAVAVLRYRLYDIDVVINRALVYGALAAFITAVYIGIVVGIGRLAGSGNRPNVALSIVATAVVAVAFQPVRERVQRLANRLVYGPRATPYEVMAGFADQMAATLSAEEVLPQMAEAAARGVGAQAARVTLYLPGSVSRSTVWPPSTGGDQFARMLPVSYRGDPVGEIAVRESPGQPITAGEGRLLADLAAQAGLVLHNVRLTAELEARLAEISAQAAELRASRQRIVAAQETERRRLGAEIEVGVQRELEATAAQLDEVERLLSDDAAAAAVRLERLTAETQRTLDGLRELAHGVFPPLLADRGIVPALKAHTRKTAIPLSIEVPAELADARFDPGVEAAVYFCCTEALRSADGPASVRLSASDGALSFTIDGVARLNGRLEGLRDRVEALGGSLAEEVPGRLDGWLPAHPMVTAG